MRWADGPLAAFDLETTGVDTDEARIVTASIAVVGSEIEPQVRDWLVDPGVEIPEGAARVHGITTEMARAEGMEPALAVEEITGRLAEVQAEDIPIVAFNARFDLTLLDREARRHGVTPLVERLGGTDGLLVVDPFILDKEVNKFRSGKRTLEVLCQAYGIPIEDAHASDADAIAAARLAWRIASDHPELAESPLPDLHDRQVAWAHEQAADLERYFRDKGREEVIDREWPIVPVAA